MPVLAAGFQGVGQGAVSRLNERLLDRYGIDEDGRPNVWVARSYSGYYYALGRLGLGRLPVIGMHDLAKLGDDCVMDAVAKAVRGGGQ